MIEVENVVLPSPAQWEAVIRGMRNPMNSWDRSDSIKTHIENPQTENTADFEFFVGDADFKLMKNLTLSGSDHRKFLRMIPVYMDITAPLYWWKEFDTYKVGTVANSCSTMHKIHAKEFTIEDFSCEHMDIRTIEVLKNIIDVLNDYRNLYVNYNAKDFEIEGCPSKKLLWWQMIQLLPSSYNQRRTVFLNYEVLSAMYKARKNHKLDEWKKLCEIIEDLPLFKELFEIKIEGEEGKEGAIE